MMREPVYNLTVEGSPEYFANGVLVHNCTTWVPGQTSRSPNRIDALVWAMHDLLLDAPGPAEAVPPPSTYGVHSLPRY